MELIFRSLLRWTLELQFTLRCNEIFNCFFFLLHFCPMNLCHTHNYYTIKIYCCAKTLSISLSLSRAHAISLVSAQLSYFAIYKNISHAPALAHGVYVNYFKNILGTFGYLRTRIYSLLTECRKWKATTTKNTYLFTIPLLLRPAIKNNSYVNANIEMNIIQRNVSIGIIWAIVWQRQADNNNYFDYFLLRSVCSCVYLCCT